MEFISRIFEKLTGAVRDSANFLYSAIMKPPRQVWGVAALGVSAICLGIYLNRRWV